MKFRDIKLSKEVLEDIQKTGDENINEIIKVKYKLPHPELDEKGELKK